MNRPDPSLPFKLGFLTHVNSYGKPAAQTYAELIDTIQAAEDLGFDGAFVAQHHFQREAGALPSPLVLLAAAAARTSRIELGTAISTIPLEDPLRFAEDAAVLDELSGGRLQLGLGTGGANQVAFEAFGVADTDVPRRYDEAVALLHDLLEGERVAGTDLTLQPPAAGLRERLWQATSQADKAERIARAGDGLFIGSFIHKPDEDQLPLVRAYLDAWSLPQQPRIGAARAVFPGASRKAALDDLSRGLRIFREHVRAFVDLSVYDDEQLAARINVHYGTPEEVADGIRRDPALLGYVDYLFPVVQHEASSVDQEIRRLEILATEIAPALGWAPTRADAA